MDQSFQFAELDTAPEDKYRDEHLDNDMPPMAMSAHIAYHAMSVA